VEELQSKVLLAQQGDLDAYDVLVRRFQDMATGFAYAVLEDFHLAEDAAQEAFVRAFLDLGKLREPAAFPGWFRQTVLNCSRLVRRSRRAQWEPISEDFPSAGRNPAEEYQRREREEQVQQAIAALPVRLREVTVLFYMSDYSQKEIAAFLGVPVSTIKKRLYDARRRLEERMLEMVEETFTGHRPSKDGAFAQEVAAAIFAALHGDAEKMGQLLDGNTELARVRGPVELFWNGDFEPLHLAAAGGHDEVVEKLLAAGADIDAVGGNNWTPLTLAISRRQKKTIALLIARGATIDLCAAVQLDDAERVRGLLAQDAKQVGGKGPENRPLLECAQSAAVARLLLDAGAASAAVDLQGALNSATWEIGQSPLNSPVRQGRREVAELLIKEGVRVGIFDAVRLDDIARARIILDEDNELLHANSAGVTSQLGNHDATPLHEAMSVEMAQLLIERGANMEALESGHRTTPLISAIHAWTCGRGNKELVDYLLEQVAEIPAIHIACVLGDLGAVERFLAEDPALLSKAGESPDLWAGYTPLHVAVQNSHIDLVRYLVEAGAELETRSGILNKTALEWAERGGKEEIAKVLRAASAQG